MVPGPEVEQGGCAPGEGRGAGKGRFKGQAAKHGAEAASEAEKGWCAGGADGRYWLPSNQREVGTPQMPSRETRSAAHGNLKNIAVVETQNTVLGR